MANNFMGEPSMSSPGLQPRISIVTPSFNQGRFLETCIRSVLGQNYPNLEFMILDSASTDESVEVIRRHEKSLSWWISEKDEGQSDAINRGFRRATGDIVAWLNADDYYLPGALLHAADAWRLQPNASFWFGRCQRVEESGRVKGEYVTAPRLMFNRDAMIFGLNFIAQPAAFIHRGHLEKAGYLNASLQYGMDTDLWIRLSGLSDPLPMEHVLAASREHGQTKTSSGAFGRIEELRQLAERHSGLGITPGALCYFLDALYTTARQHPEVFPPEFQNEITRFWAGTSALLAQWGADPAGTPVVSQASVSQNPLKKSMMKVLGLS